MKKVICIGAGPAGLTAAYLLTKENYTVTVLEKDPVYVGGISRTVKYKDFCFDIGGHRFFSKSQEIEDLWTEILGDDLLVRPRKSRIYFDGKFYPYPLQAFETLKQMGMIEAARCLLSYLKARILPIKKVTNFENWVINRFGQRLYLKFFKTYTEKVWGISCLEISSDWAAQRIHGLSLSSAIIQAITPKFLKKKNKIKTLIDSFRYPRKGPGMMWEKTKQLIEEQSGEVIHDSTVSRIVYQSREKVWQVTYTNHSGIQTTIDAEHIISSMPLRDLIKITSADFSEEVKSEAKKLNYRDFLIVALIVKEKNIFDDNWIYIHGPEVKVGRIQNFKSWSPEMIPDHNFNCYGMEYFCFEGDNLWDSTDDALKELAIKELVQLKLTRTEDVTDAHVIRQTKAYPVYDEGYQKVVELIKIELEQKCPNLHIIGRGGMHKYNNQDHAMMTAMLTVKNILLDKNQYNIWDINQDAEYHEYNKSSESDSSLRYVPVKK